MDLTLSANERAFRDELRPWLEVNHPGGEPRGGRSTFARRGSASCNAAGYAGCRRSSRAKVDAALLGSARAHRERVTELRCLGAPGA